MGLLTMAKLWFNSSSTVVQQWLNYRLKTSVEADAYAAILR